MPQSSFNSSKLYFELAIAIVALMAGLALRYWINRRRFNRRNMAGIQVYSNYEAAVFIRLLEFLGKVLGFALILVGLAGIFHYVYTKNHPQKLVNNSHYEHSLPQKH